MRIRRPAVAGRFYTGDGDELRDEVTAYIEAGRARLEAIPRPVAGMAPHAGYVFSGRTAGVFYASLQGVPDTVIILGPNHTGYGLPMAVDEHDAWETPLGTVELDGDLRARLLSSGVFQPDSLAHAYEHSLEVQVPFLHVLRQDVRIVPICVGTSSLHDARRAAEALVKATSDLSDDQILVVASTDMSHYISAELAKKKDALAFEAIKRLDGEALYSTVHSHDITMCGYMPVTIAMMWARARGAERGIILDYTNSGEVLGDYDQVVAYAAGAFVR